MRPKAAPTSGSCVTTITVVPGSWRADRSSPVTAPRIPDRAGWSARRPAAAGARWPARPRPPAAAAHRRTAARPAVAPPARARPSPAVWRPGGASPRGSPGRSLREHHVACGGLVRKEITARRLHDQADVGSRIVAAAFGFRSPSRRPQTSTTPAVGRSSPANSHSRVDLPAPDGPSRATLSPSATVRSTPRSAVTSCPAPRIPARGSRSARSSRSRRRLPQLVEPDAADQRDARPDRRDDQQRDRRRRARRPAARRAARRTGPGPTGWW